MYKFLSAEELRDKRFLPRNLPEKAAAKGCGPEDDVVGDYKLERLLNDRLAALCEPKVEKLSSLIRGEWLPDKRAVKVVKRVGKHLQHMGYTVETQHMLYLEEAMFLIDTKCMEVYYKSVPLSEQEAYSVFFGCEANLRKYQVYAHLSRLGYTVVRHQGRSTVSNYERMINLDKYVNRGRRKMPKAQIGSNKTDSACSGTQTPGTEAGPVADNAAILEKESGHYAIRPSAETPDEPCLLVRHPEITIPDAYGKNLYALLAAQPKYLPPNVKLRKEMYTVDLCKLYTRHNMSGRGFKAHCFKKAKDKDDSLALRLVEAPRWNNKRNTHKRWKSNSGQWHCNGPSPQQDGPNEDVDHYSPGVKRKFDLPKVAPKSEVKTKARSWRQYKRELDAPEDTVRAIELLSTPNVRPLLEPAKATSTAAVLSELQIIKATSLPKSSSVTDPQESDLLDLTYDVYLPSMEYKKNAASLPNHRLVVTSASEPLPEVVKIMRTMRYLNDGVAIHFAVVSDGDVAFYTFKEVQLPVLVSMG